MFHLQPPMPNKKHGDYLDFDLQIQKTFRWHLIELLPLDFVCGGCGQEPHHLRRHTLSQKPLEIS